MYYHKVYERCSIMTPRLWRIKFDAKNYYYFKEYNYENI